MNCFPESPICVSSLLPGCVCFCVWKKAGFKCQKEGIRFPILLPTKSTFTSLFPPLNVKWCLWSTHIGLELSQGSGLPGGQHNGITLYLNFLLWCSWRLLGTLWTGSYLKWEQGRGTARTHERLPPNLNKENQWATTGQFHPASVPPPALFNSCPQLLWPTPSWLNSACSLWSKGKCDTPSSAEKSVKKDQFFLLNSHRWGDQTHQLDSGVHVF